MRCQSATFSHCGYLEPQIYSPLDYVMQKQVTGFSKPQTPTLYLTNMKHCESRKICVPVMMIYLSIMILSFPS